MDASRCVSCRGLPARDTSETRATHVRSDEGLGDARAEYDRVEHCRLQLFIHGVWRNRREDYKMLRWRRSDSEREMRAMRRVGEARAAADKRAMAMASTLVSFVSCCVAVP